MLPPHSVTHGAERDPAYCSRLQPAEYSATSGPGERIPCSIDRQCPNISTERNQPTADVGPIVPVVCRTESSTSGTCENVTGGVDCQCVNIVRCEATILFRPSIAVVGRTEDAATDTELGKSSGKDVTGRADRQRGNVSRS